jgi:hypothetical protein
MAAEGRTFFPIPGPRLAAQQNAGGSHELVPGLAAADEQYTAPRRALAGTGPSHHAHSLVTPGHPFLPWPGMYRTCRLLAGRDTGAPAAGQVHVDL